MVNAIEESGCLVKGPDAKGRFEFTAGKSRFHFQKLANGKIDLKLFFADLAEAVKIKSVRDPSIPATIDQGISLAMDADST